ncbi:hypothetical protein BGZ60DRAFT_434714 [Tricladium varicosporioides]|nr:hypothetical protein BGZ60DRAFT_434714 [Hymenoscyphus varicosporioides]
MANLSEMPVEVLNNIFSFIAGPPLGKYDVQKRRAHCLSAISKVCRCFHTIIRPLLFDNITISFGRGPTKAVQLMRSLEEHPELVKRVRNITVYFGYSGKVSHSNGNELLKVVSDVQCLTINTIYGDAPFKPHFLDKNPMSKLRTIKVFDDQLRMTGMQEYIRIPQVQQFSFACPFLGEFPQTEKQTSNLLALDLDIQFHIPANTLGKVLSMCPRIKHLRCAIPGNRTLDGRNNQTIGVSSPVSPKEISEALANAQDSLEKLELVHCECRWGGHDNSKMDLSMMKTLKYIYSPHWVFGTGYEYGIKSGLYKFLPASLEELSIHFQDLRSATGFSPYLKPDYEDHFRKEKMEYGLHGEAIWILQLVDHKDRYLPLLRTLKFTGGSDYDSNPLPWWKPHKHVVESLREVGIGFMRRVQEDDC